MIEQILAGEEFAPLRALMQSLKSNADLDAYLDGVAKLQSVSGEQEQELLRRMAAGDAEAKRQLTEGSLRKQVSVAVRKSKRGISLLRLILIYQECLLGTLAEFEDKPCGRFFETLSWRMRRAEVRIFVE